MVHVLSFALLHDSEEIFLHTASLIFDGQGWPCLVADYWHNGLASWFPLVDSEQAWCYMFG
jgi:hypothetical protein